jgi:transcription antitermination factor NusG
MTNEPSQWHAIRVRSRCEKSASAELSRRGISVFPALAAQRRIWVDRVRVVEMPVFPGYIFGKFAWTQLRTVESASVVASVVRFGNQASPVDEQEIESVRVIVHSGLDVVRSPQMKLGARVRVVAGPLKGAEGVLTDFRVGYQLVVSVGLLQRSISVEIDEAMVEPVNRSERYDYRARAGAA